MLLNWRSFVCHHHIERRREVQNHFDLVSSISNYQYISKSSVWWLNYKKPKMIKCSSLQSWHNIHVILGLLRLISTYIVFVDVFYNPRIGSSMRSCPLNICSNVNASTNHFSHQAQFCSADMPHHQQFKTEIPSSNRWYYINCFL